MARGTDHCPSRCGLLVAFVLSSIFTGPALWVQPTDDCLGVLVLDLDGDGLRLSDLRYPVRFDIDGDTVPDTLSWTAVNHDEAFLWLDRGSRPLPASGADLFTSTPAGRDGELWESAFLQLRRLDSPAQGGNADGLLSPEDRTWADLRLWIDHDHDGRPRSGETSDLRSRGILRIELRYHELHRVDGNLNRHLRASRFVAKRDGKRRSATLTEVCLHVAESSAGAE